MPRKKSKALKELTGTLDSRTKDALTYPAPTEKELRVPAYLGKIGRSLWRRLSALLLSQNVLQVVDLQLLAQYCNLADGLMAAIADIAENGYTLTASATTRTGQSEKRYANPSVALQLKYQAAMQSAGSRLGFSPRDRELISAELATVRRYTPTPATTARAPKKVSEMSESEAIEAFNI
jgi:P27 family predicted phage terminase small subunit